MEAKENVGNSILIKLTPREGGPESVTGMVDKRLFQGDNDLHAILDRQSMLWHLEYTHGTVPVPLQQRFTGLRSMEQTVKNYYDKRNVDIEVVL